jgi:hypothetical protein
MGRFLHLTSRGRIDRKEKKSSPQEETRLQVPRVFLEEAIGTMHETIQGRQSELVFNLDDVGISDWEDRKPKKVVVPIRGALTIFIIEYLGT